MPSVRFVERFDLTTPRFALAIIDLAQIQNWTLHHTTTRTASAFDNAPVPVLLAVLPSPCESQVHGPRFYAQTKSRKEGRSSLHAFPPHRPLKRFSFRRQNSKIAAPVGKVGLRPSWNGYGCDELPIWRNKATAKLDWAFVPRRGGVGVPSRVAPRNVLPTRTGPPRSHA